MIISFIDKIIEFLSRKDIIDYINSNISKPLYQYIKTYTIPYIYILFSMYVILVLLMIYIIYLLHKISYNR